MTSNENNNNNNKNNNKTKTKNNGNDKKSLKSKCAWCEREKERNDLCNRCRQKVESRARSLNEQKMLGDSKVLSKIVTFWYDNVNFTNIKNIPKFCKIFIETLPFLMLRFQAENTYKGKIGNTCWNIPESTIRHLMKEFYKKDNDPFITKQLTNVDITDMKRDELCLVLHETALNKIKQITQNKSNNNDNSNDKHKNNCNNNNNNNNIKDNSNSNNNNNNNNNNNSNSNSNNNNNNNKIGKNVHSELDDRNNSPSSASTINFIHDASTSTKANVDINVQNIDCNNNYINMNGFGMNNINDFGIGNDIKGNITPINNNNNNYNYNYNINNNNNNNNNMNMNNNEYGSGYRNTDASKFNYNISKNNEMYGNFNDSNNLSFQMHNANIVRNELVTAPILTDHFKVQPKKNCENINTNSIGFDMIQFNNNNNNNNNNIHNNTNIDNMNKITNDNILQTQSVHSHSTVMNLDSNVNTQLMTHFAHRNDININNNQITNNNNDYINDNINNSNFGCWTNSTISNNNDTSTNGSYIDMNNINNTSNLNVNDNITSVSNSNTMKNVCNKKYNHTSLNSYGPIRNSMHNTIIGNGESHIASTMSQMSQMSQMPDMYGMYGMPNISNINTMNNTNINNIKNINDSIPISRFNPIYIEKNQEFIKPIAIHKTKTQRNSEMEVNCMGIKSYSTNLPLPLQQQRQSLQQIQSSKTAMY